MAKSPNLSRNDFVKFTVGVLGAIMGGIVGIPAVGYLLSPALQGGTSKEAWIPMGPVENYPIGVPTLFTFTRSKVNGWEKSVNSYGVFVVRKSETEVEIFSNICTHLACRVNWKEDRQEFVCPCHDGLFNINGEVTGGPPPRPMDKYTEFKIEEGVLSFLFSEGKKG
jgi:menaquinol-cytochrome c reductase iron-sulfur subunit